MYKFIGVNLSKPHNSKSPTQLLCHRPCANNYRENRKTHYGLPCHGEVYSMGYMTSLLILFGVIDLAMLYGIDY